MNIKGKRIFNNRPLCFFAAALCLGIIIGEASYATHIGVLVSLSVLFAAATVAFVCVKKIRKLFYIPLALAVGFAAINVSNAVYDSRALENYTGTFSATVSSEIIVETDSAGFYVSDVRLDGRKLKGETYVYVPFEIEPDYNAGDSVILYGKLSFNAHKKFDTAYASNRANDRCYFVIAGSVRKASEGSAPFPLDLQLKIKKLLNDNADEYTASICQALVLGDKRGIDAELYDDIAASGLAHVLAVSGLHITTLAGALFFILKKLKLNPKISFFIVAAATLFYSMLCSFSASSLRAFIMTATLSFSSAFGLKRDNLSALSLAAILILIFRPTALMEIGFLLSFYAVLGIFLFYGGFKRIGMKAVDKISPKRHFGTKFVDVCALSFATNIATLPIVSYFIGSVPTLFIFSNFIVLPYIMAVYILLLICVVLSLITGFGGFIWIMKFLLIPFRIYVGAVGNLPLSAVPTGTSVAGIVCFTAIMLLASKYIFAGKRVKIAGCALTCAVSVAICAAFATV